MVEITVMQQVKEFNFDKGTIGQILDLCTKCNQEEAMALLKRYRFCNEYADQNLGYIFGYCGKETREKLYSLFPVNHPIFGDKFGRE